MVWEEKYSVPSSASRVAIKKHQRFKGFTPLELPEDAREHWAEHLGRDWVKDGAHVRVTRDSRNAIDRVQIALSPLLVKGQERGALRENMAKADMSASVKEISVSSRRCSRQAGKAAVH